MLDFDRPWGMADRRARSIGDLAGRTQVGTGIRIAGTNGAERVLEEGIWHDVTRKDLTEAAIEKQTLDEASRSATATTVLEPDARDITQR